MLSPLYQRLIHRLEIPIHISPQHHNIHTKIQPQHHKNDRRDRPVNDRERTEMVNIVRIDHTEQHPADRGDDRTGQFGQNAGTAVRQSAEDNQKE